MIREFKTTWSKLLLGGCVCALTACGGGGGDSGSFADLEEKSILSKGLELDGPIVISSWTPTSETVVLPQFGEETFGITIEPGAGPNVKYLYAINGETKGEQQPDAAVAALNLQEPEADSADTETQEDEESLSPFFRVAATEFNLGTNTLVFRAENPIANAEHSFTVYRNQPPVKVTALPEESEVKILCDGSIGTFDFEAMDPDGDSITFKWLLNNKAADESFDIINAEKKSKLFYTPNCEQKGLNTLTVLMEDGKDTSSFQWQVRVKDPEEKDFDPIEILEYSPLSNPTVVSAISETTFAITVNAGAGEVEYTVLLDGKSVQSSKTPFYLVEGAGLSTGAHKLTIRAKNDVNEVEQSFNILKNSPPEISFVNPAASGSSVGCGGESLTFTVLAEDANDDDLQYKWILDGNVIAAGLVTGELPDGAQALYAPACDALGSHTVKVEITDGHDKVDFTWGLVVIDPSITNDGPVNIVDWAPQDDVIVFASDEEKTIAVTVGAEAGNNVTYQYKIDGTILEANGGPFFVLGADDFPAPGSYTFEVYAFNPEYSDTKEFMVHLNTPPTVAANNPATPPSIECGGNTQAYDVTGADEDGDGLTFTWKVNGSVAPSQFTQTDAENTSAVVFTPDCSLEGTATISVEITDGFETVTHSWTQTVTNPFTANISDCTPKPLCALEDPNNRILVLSSEIKVFTVTGIGKFPLVYQWDLGGVIPGETSSILELDGATVPTGDHTLTVTLTDNGSNTDTFSFYIERNAPPVCVTPDPSVLKKIAVADYADFTITCADDNDATNTLTYAWTLDGLPAPAFFSETDNGATGTPKVRFSPDDTLLGNHTLRLTVTDPQGESTFHDWSVNVNQFSRFCNELGAGEICTFVGSVGVGSGVDPAANGDELRVRPADVVEDGTADRNLFISDVTNHSVWFYNRSAGDIVKFGVTVPAGATKIVAGNGASGNGTSGLPATNYQFNAPYGIDYDTSRDILYVADYSNGYVVRVNSAGIATKVFGRGVNNTNNSTTNGDGVVGTSHLCREPTGVAVDEDNDRVYVSCNYHHAIKRFEPASDADPSNIAGYIVIGKTNGSGTTSASSASGTIGYGGASGTDDPWGIAIDSQKRVYWTEWDRCRVRVVNMSGSTLSMYGGAVTVDDERSGVVFGVWGSCANQASVYTSARVRYPRGVAPLLDGSNNLLGVFASGGDQDRVLFANTSSSNLTFGDQEIVSNTVDFVMGNGTGDFNSDGLVGRLTQVNWPHSLELAADNSELYVADRDNYRLRSLDLTVDAGTVSTVFGSGKLPQGIGGNDTKGANEIQLCNPRSLALDETNDKLYYNNTCTGTPRNNRVKSINLNTGEITTAAGSGTVGNASAENEEPHSAHQYYTYGLFVQDGNLFYADSRNNANPDRNCQVRVVNIAGIMDPIFGVNVDDGKVATVAGNYNEGCGAFTSDYEGDLGSTVRLYYPHGISSDGTDMYIANYQNHCILKVAADGTTSTYLGSCGSAGGTNNTYDLSAVGSMRLRYPNAVTPDPLHPGNLFIIDKYDRADTKLRYANFTASEVTVGGTPTPPGFVNTLATIPRYAEDIAVTSTHYCYSERTTHNVVCVNRATGSSATIGSSLPDSGRALGTEQEQISPSTSKLWGPWGVVIAPDGSIYISEYSAASIRKVEAGYLP